MRAAPFSPRLSFRFFYAALWFVYLFGLCFMAFLPVSSALAKESLFQHSNSRYEADRYFNRVKANKPNAIISVEEWQEKAALARKDNLLAARSYYEAALNGAPKNTKLWLDLARTLQDLIAGQKNRRNNYGLNRDGTAASFNAFRFAKDDRTRAEALAVLGYFLRARSYWRPALNAYKASLDLSHNATVQKVYKELRAEKGFRITNYKINSDLRQPRLCVQFSENLIAKQTDYAPFFKVNKQDPDAVRVEKRQICLDGFKHGETYKVTVRQGLPSLVGEDLLKSTDLTIYVRDRSASVRFSSKAYVLPKFGQRGLPLVSVNSKQADFQIFRVGDRNVLSTVVDGQFQSNLNDYDARELGNKIGAEIYKGTLEIASVLNEDVKTALPVQKLLPKMKPGLYVVRAWPSESKYGSNRGATQWFIVSDIGLATLKAQDGVHGFVRSITSTAPLKGVLVRLIAKNNDVLGTNVSDDKGFVHFHSNLLAGKGGDAPAMLVAETGEGDYGFVDLTKPAFDLTDRGVGGRQAPQRLDGFVFAERGVYRPGEEVQLTALLRNQKGNGVVGLPLTLIVTRPDGKEHKRVTLADQGAGGRSYSLPLIQSAMTGTWRVNLYGDTKRAAVGSTSFLVEDYVPERMELVLKKLTDVWSKAQPAEVKVSGVYLYGAPATNHELKGDLTISKRVAGLPGYEGYRFGLQEEKFLNVHKSLSNLGLLNEKGKSLLNLKLPDFERPAKPLEAKVNVRLLEPGGRQVVRALTFPVATDRPMIGIKQLSSDKEMKQQKKARFEVVRLDQKMRKSSEILQWELVKVDKYYQWYNQNGYWRYEPVTYSNRVAKGQVETLEDNAVPIEVPVERGHYRLEIVSPTYSQLAANVDFTVDWYGAKDADTPDVLEIASDKATYAVGDKLTVRVKPKAKGRTLVAIMNETVLAVKEAPFGSEGGEVVFDVEEKWGAGAYAIAMHYHELNEQNAQMPGRAIGVKWIKLDEAPRRLQVAIQAPAHLSANKAVTLPVQVTGLSAGEKAYVVVAAVDEGILSLTGYQSPEPQKHYYGQRRLASEIRDIYGHLINGMGGVVGRVRSGGDAGGLALQGAPNTIKPVALYSGIVEIDQNGRAEVAFEIPQFNGALRVMSVAWSKGKLGSSSQKLIVRDPVVVLASTPLFMTKGDVSNLFLSIDNVDGPEGTYKLQVASKDGKLGFDTKQMAAPLSLLKGQRVNVALSMKAKELGSSQIKLSLTPSGDGAETTTPLIAQSYDLYIKPPQPNASWRTVKKLAPNGGKLTLSKDVFADIIPETARASLTVGQLAGLDVPGLFETLDRYPYGCAEQTTSRALPLLYVAKLAPLYGKRIADDLPKRIENAIQRLAALQNAQGGFGLWSPHYADMWLTAYVTDFLTRAREQKYAVDPQMIASALQRLKNTVNFASDFKKGGETLAYALYVLARNGEAAIGDLRYYADTKIRNFSTPTAQAQIAASLAMYGDMTRAQAAFQVAYETMQKRADEAGTSWYRVDYGSKLRDRAALLALSSEAKQSSLPKVKLISALMEARAEKRFTSTQENAWMLLAANALESEDRALLLNVNGAEVTGLYRHTFTPKDLAATDLTIANNGAEEVSAVMTVHGSSLNPLPKLEQGLGLQRQFFSLDGKEISLLNAKQNDRVVVVVTITDPGQKGGRLLLSDPLPAGFMIENPNLISGTNLRHFSWLKTSIWPVHQSFRDDKFVAAFNLSTGRKKAEPRVIKVAYIMRAAYLGRFIHPAAFVEDMYRPNRFARTNAQYVLIEKP